MRTEPVEQAIAALLAYAASGRVFHKHHTQFEGA